MPVKVEFGLLAFPKLPPVPLTTDHWPVPTTGVLAAKVVVVTPQREVWGNPAMATVGIAFTAIVAVAVPVQLLASVYE